MGGRGVGGKGTARVGSGSGKPCGREGQAEGKVAERLQWQGPVWGMASRDGLNCMYKGVCVAVTLSQRHKCIQNLQCGVL